MKDLLSQAHMWPQGWNSTAAFLSEQTTHSSICKRTDKWRVWSLGWLVRLQLKQVGGRGAGEGGRSGITLVLDWTWSLQMRHFFTRGEQREQVAMCPQGPNSVSLFMSEHTMHSSSDSMLLFRDGLRVPTCPLHRSEGKQDVNGGKYASLHQPWLTFSMLNTSSLIFPRYCLPGGYDLISFSVIKDNPESSFFRPHFRGCDVKTK